MEAGRRELTITAEGHGGSRAALRELWAAREVVRAFAVRALRIRYRQAVLGVLWALVQPLALLVPFAVLLRARDAEGGTAATLAALIGWQFLSGALTNGAGALVSEAHLIRKTWFPREAPVVAAVGVALVDLGLGVALFALVGPFLGASLGAGTLLLPLVAAALALSALALAIPLAALNALFRDVRHALPFVVLLWLFLSPVAYSVDRVSGRWRLAWAVLNPAVGPLAGLRASLAAGDAPDLGLLAASAASSAVILAAGHAVFRRIAPTLPDVI